VVLAVKGLGFSIGLNVKVVFLRAADIAGTSAHITSGEDINPIAKEEKEGMFEVYPSIAVSVLFMPFIALISPAIFLTEL
jgi:hypothetical protein